MAIKKTALAKLLVKAKIAEDETKALALIDETEEKDVAIAEDLNILTKAELDARDKNKYDTGKKAGEGMLIDTLKKKHEVEAPGDDPEKFVENLTKKIKKELDTNPDARLVEKDKQLDQVKKLLKEANERGDGFKTQTEQLQGDAKLLNMLPQNRVETMTTEEFLGLTKSAIKLEMRDGKEVAIRNGAVVVDTKTADPLAPKEVIKSYYEERKWIKPVEEEKKMGGRGGKNSDGGGAGIGKYSKLSEVHKSLEEEGISLNGEEAMKRIQAAQKENPEMDLRS